MLTKALYGIGLSGITVGAVEGVAGDAIMNGSNAAVWSDYVGIGCAIGGLLCLVVRSGVSIYFDRRKEEREQAEELRRQELHDYKLKGGE